MSSWVKRFEEHPILGEVQVTLDLLNQIDGFSEGNSEIIENCQRIRQVLNHVVTKLSNCDPVMVAKTTLDNLNSSLQPVKTELYSFISNRNVGHLSNANTNIDTVLIHSASIIYPMITPDFEGIRDSISSFRRSIGQQLRHVEEEYRRIETIKNELETSFSQLGATVEAQKSRLDTSIIQFQQQFSNSEESRRATFVQEEDKRKSQNDELREQRNDEHNTLIEEFKEQFDELYKLRNTEIDTLIEECKTRHDQAHKQRKDQFVGCMDEYQNKFGNQMEALEADGKFFKDRLLAETEDYTEALKRYKEHAENLVNVIGNTGMVGGYQKVANEEKLSAQTWRKISLGALICLSLFALFSFNFLQSTFSWSQLSSRMFVAATLGTLAAYAAKQASEHKKAERFNRKMELELASIDPYLVGLPDEMLFKTKEMLAEKFFGNELPVEIIKEQDTGDGRDLTRMSMEALLTLIKNAKLTK